MEMRFKLRRRFDVAAGGREGNINHLAATPTAFKSIFNANVFAEWLEG